VPLPTSRHDVDHVTAPRLRIGGHAAATGIRRVEMLGTSIRCERRPVQSDGIVRKDVASLQLAGGVGDEPMTASRGIGGCRPRSTSNARTNRCRSGVP